MLLYMLKAVTGRHAYVSHWALGGSNLFISVNELLQCWVWKLYFTPNNKSKGKRRACRSSSICAAQLSSWLSLMWWVHCLVQTDICLTALIVTAAKDKSWSLLFWLYQEFSKVFRNEFFCNSVKFLNYHLMTFMFRQLWLQLHTIRKWC